MSQLLVGLITKQIKDIKCGEHCGADLLRGRYLIKRNTQRPESIFYYGEIILQSFVCFAIIEKRNIFPSDHICFLSLDSYIGDI